MFWLSHLKLVSSEDPRNGVACFMHAIITQMIIASRKGGESADALTTDTTAILTHRLMTAIPRSGRKKIYEFALQFPGTELSITWQKMCEEEEEAELMIMF